MKKYCAVFLIVAVFSSAVANAGTDEVKRCMKRCMEKLDNKEKCVELCESFRVH